jgi:CheY-like chemotaxis protein
MRDSNRYIIIDDSQIDIFIASRMLQNFVPGCSILSFLNAQEALENLIHYTDTTTTTVLLVDINMPVMDGFQFMEKFEQLPEKTKNSYIACFLTSSINESDIAMAKTIPSIRLYINKPLSQNNIQNILSITS